VGVKLVIKHNEKEVVGIRTGWITKKYTTYEVQLVESEGAKPYYITCVKGRTEWAIY